MKKACYSQPFRFRCAKASKSTWSSFSDLRKAATVMLQKFWVRLRFANLWRRSVHQPGTRPDSLWPARSFMIFVDTGAWFASIVPWDANFSAATNWLRQNQERLVTTDYIIDETLTLLRARREYARASMLGQELF